MFVCCYFRVLSGTGLCDELSFVQRSPTDLVRPWVWYRNLKNEEAMTHLGLLRQTEKINTTALDSNVKRWMQLKRNTYLNAHAMSIHITFSHRKAAMKLNWMINAEMRTQSFR